MRFPRPWRTLLGIVPCLVLLACAAGALPAAAGSGQDARGASLRLDLANRSLVLPLESRIAEPENVKFVQIEIGELHNPRLIRFLFEVRYRPETGPAVLLGTFSPFPPDNPGTYIVPAQGKLRGDGAILISLVPLDEVRPADVLRVSFRAITFRAG